MNSGGNEEENPMSVALIGSSGGGTATLGHTDPVQLLRVIGQELRKANASLDQVLFVALEGGKGMDTAQPTDSATLYSIRESHLQIVKTGTLQQVNAVCRELDETVLSKAVADGRVRGLICVSCSVDLHAATLRAAADGWIPVTGSGGTSLSAATARFGIRLVGNAGGSVATTTYTRAASYTHALAAKTYQPFADQTTPQWTSVANACLPAFWTVCLTKRLLTVLQPILTDDWDVFHKNGLLWMGLQSVALPTVCCIIMAHSQAEQYGSTVLMAAGVAGVLGCSGSMLAGLLAGWLVSTWSGRALHRCIRWGVPATMTNLLVAGGVGSLVGLFVLPIAPYLQQMTAFVRSLIHWSMSGNVPGVGFLIGCLFCYGSKVGYYHLVGLPVILVEMEHGDASLWGAIDEATLVLVSAGICAGNLMWPPSETSSQQKETLALCRRGLRINMLYGDFIEAAYPFMEKSWVINTAGYLASGISTELMTSSSQEVLSLAYLPVPVSLWLAVDWQRLSTAYGAAFGVTMVGTILSNGLFSFKNAEKSS